MKLRIIDLNQDEILCEGYENIQINIGDEITLDTITYETISIHHNLDKSYTEIYVREYI